MNIAIITRGRIEQQKALKRLTPNIRQHVTLFCYEGEGVYHERNWGGGVRGVVEYPSTLSHIGEIREWVILHSTESKIIMLDDNVRFSVVTEDRPSPLVINDKNLSESEMSEVLQKIFDWLWEAIHEPDVAISGLSFRPFNRKQHGGVKYNERFFAVWGLDIDKYLDQYTDRPLLMSDWGLKEDFIAGISVIQNGYKIAINYDYAFDKCQGANQSGGCSLYRTIEYSNEISRRMAIEFPDIVKLREKDGRVGWNGEFLGKKFLEVTINWDKIRCKRKR